MKLHAVSPIVVIAAAAAIAAGATGCPNRERTDSKKIVLGFVVKCETNPIFQACKVGARDAAAELGRKYGADVEIDWQTPVDEDAQKQAQYVDALAAKGVAGIAVSCTDANTLAPAIDRAVAKGIPVMCVDTDAPRSKRFCYFGTDDFTAGATVMKQLAKEMGEKGTVAIIAGNQEALNLANRVKGAKEELKNHPNMKLIDDGVIYHEESPEKSAEAVARAQAAKPGIEGWCFIGGWPLNTRNALKWKPGEIKVASLDALPPMVTYLESGHVQALFLQNSYEWGTKSVDILLKKILRNEDPEKVLMYAELPRVDKDNMKDVLHWDRWLGKKAQPAETEKK